MTRSLHHILVLLLAHRPDGRLEAADAARSGQSTREQRDHLTPQREAIRIGPIVEQSGAAAQVIEDDDTGWPVQLDLWLLARRRGPSGETMGDIETDRPYEPAVEWDRGRDRAWCRRLHQDLAQPVHEPLHRPVGFDAGGPGLDRPPVTANIEAGAEADERVAPDLVTLLHALEKEAGAQRGEFEVHRRRRVEVGRYVEDGVHGLLRRSGVRASNEKTHLPESGDGFV